jgi:hypothetical protein
MRRTSAFFHPVHSGADSETAGSGGMDYPDGSCSADTFLRVYISETVVDI